MTSPTAGVHDRLLPVLALWPGFSRSGSTIAGGMLVGVNRYAASEFSFIWRCR